jgi:nitrite reductase/ring-hydroxylating ferredoxin subunit
MGAVSSRIHTDPGGNDTSRLSERTRAGRWQAEFPFGTDADDLVTRRQMLRWSVGVAGALFGMTGLLAGLGFARARRRGETKAIIAAGELAVDEVHYFEYPDAGDHAILLRLDEDRYVAYGGICTHLSCEVYWNADERALICPCHNGHFDPATGDVLAGPPPRPLPFIHLREEDGTIYAVEEVTRGNA